MRSTILAACLAAACLQAQAQMPSRLYLTTEARSTYGGQAARPPAGVSTDTIRAMMARAGIVYSLDPLPWKRAYNTALERPDACVYATSRIPERERQFKWVGPISQIDWVLMARADRGLQLRSLEDARGLRIGTYNGDVRDQYLRVRGFDVDPVTEDLGNPRKLMMNRIDLWATSTQRGAATVKRLGYAGKIVPILTFNRTSLYLACNRAVPDALVARMNEALASMERDGSRRAILDKHAEARPEEGQAGVAGR